jgi:hypothetical protein
MGRADSPLRDKVIFLEGAPRSGTTWLVRLLASHPRVAGVGAESHLFDFGVDRLFDNLEQRDAKLRGLISYMDREELVDAVRDLCDRAFLAMRDHLASDPPPDHVVEKTPVGARRDGLDLERKRDCYPDAWHIHIVREREAVVRSLMKAPFMSDRSYENCAGLWDSSVGNIRRVFGDSPRYREVGYEQLLADPVRGCADLLGWVGLETDDETRAALAVLARERVSELGPPVQAMPSRTGLRGRARALARGARARREPPRPQSSALDRLGFDLVAALRRRDAEGLAALTHPKFEYVLRAPEGDLLVEGDAARSALLRLAEATFSRRHIGEWWAAAPPAQAEWWTSVPGKPFWSVSFSTLNGDATRADVSLVCTLEDDRVRRIVAITAGPPAGRPIAAARAVDPQR